MTSTYLEKRSVCVKCLSCFNSQRYFSLYLLTLAGLLWSQQCGEPAVMSLLTYSVRTNVLCGQIPPVSICVQTDSRLTMRGYKTGSTHSGSADSTLSAAQTREAEEEQTNRAALSLRIAAPGAEGGAVMLRRKDEGENRPAPHPHLH